MAPPGGNISTAPGSAPWINPDSVAGAKLKEAGLAQRTVGGFKTLLLIAGACFTAPSGVSSLPVPCLVQ